jgi:hypothetical protein
VPWVPVTLPFNSDVLCGQRVALMGIADIQYGHAFVVVAATGGFWSRLTWRISKEIAKATMGLEFFSPRRIACRRKAWIYTPVHFGSNWRV